jgi:hypothetical protein
VTLGDGGLVISNFITGLSYPLPGCLAGAARGGVAAVVYPVGEDETAFYGGLQAKEKAATGAAFYFLPSIIRIPSPAYKSAKYLCVVWRVSGEL